MFSKKPKVKKLFLLAILSVCFARGFAQQDPKIETARLMTLLNKLEGTYQVQIIDSREEAAIPLSLMDTIVLQRHATLIKYVWLKGNTRVKILPESEISLDTFKPLSRVKHVSSSELN